MKVLDLTHDLTETMPVYPGTEPPRITQATTIAREGFAEKRISLYSHTGTHMDAPAHMVAGARTLDAFEAAHFVGPGAVLDVSSCREGTIGVEWIEPHAERLRGLSFVLLRSGWSKRWGQPSYFEGFPVLTEEAARLLCTLGLHGIGLDMLSVDPVASQDFPIHNLLLRQGYVIVENLTNLEALDPAPFLFSCLPLKIPAADGSPVRAVALYP